MHIAILADIHANLAALEAVFRDIDTHGGADELWCLGDIVGYGPDPTECIALLKKYNPVCVAGNHDRGAAGKLDLSHFNPAAALACQWTQRTLNPVDIRYLEELPVTLKRGDFTLVHGSPTEPLLEYIMSISIADKNFDYFETKYCLVGHSHLPVAYKKEAASSSAIALKPTIGLVMTGHRMIINPGAVGQPRDGDPRASYGIYDSEGQMFHLHRVEYNIRETQDKMMRAGLPITLVTRLEQGK
jgi:diadenosine tetraphosphatase ApaH/serine/threonine PP2A family protein phosphatase